MNRKSIVISDQYMQPTFPPLLHDVANYVVEELVCFLGYDAYLEEQHEGWPQVTHGPGKRSKNYDQ